MVSGQRPFSGRSLPELTQAIVNSAVRPPSSYAPELSPELEQIILVAMARDRDDRYEQAMLLSRDLRALNLNPTPSYTQTAGPPSSTNGQRPAHGKIVIHPPKRPQMQLPRYLELENTQPPVNEPVANSPAQPVETSQTPASASTPTASQQSPIESSPHREPEIDTEGPTGPLAYTPHIATPPQNHKSRKRQRRTPSRQPFWQKLFKPPR